ncbi:MAG TPA: hypothetical protein VLM91_12860, partial [Candidatus Methylomirabilis sp.]|nr:hypothetical protein [Candidatus Methylomirabilis sp.]
VFDPTSRWLATHSQDNTVRVWDVETGRERHRLTHDAAPTHLATSADGRRISATTAAGEVYVWDAETGTLLRRITQLQGENPLKFRNSEFVNRDKGLLLGVDAAHLIGYRGLDTDEPQDYDVFNPKRRYDAYIAVRRLSADGEYLAVGYDDGAVCLWKRPFDWTSLCGEWRHTTRAADLGVTDIAFTPDSRRVASVGYDAVAKVWDIRAGKQVSEFRGHPGICVVEGKVAISNGGNIAMTTTVNDRLDMVFWDVETGAEVERVAVGELCPGAVTVNPTRGQVLTVGWPNAVLWQTPLADPEALLAACRGLLPRAMLRSERERYGLSGEPPSWQLDLWPYTDPVTLLREGMQSSYALFSDGVLSELRSRLARLEGMGIRGASDHLHVFAYAILNSYSRELEGLANMRPFSRDEARLMDLLAYCWDETMSVVMRGGDIAGARRILAEHKGIVGYQYPELKAQLGEGV